MSLSERAVRRPVATTMVFIALMVVGGYSFVRLEVDVFPELDFPSISVVTEYPGVSPEEMETLVTRPVEGAIARVKGIDRIESFSAEGRSRVALRFDWGVNLDSAANDVREVLGRVRARLPEDIEAPAIYKFDISNISVMDLALRADLDEGRLRRFAEDVAKPYLERVGGVASVNVSGARQREIRVELDPQRLAARGVTPAEVAAAIRSSNLTVPSGVVGSGRENILVRPMGEFDSIRQIRRSVVSERAGQPIRVEDVATVVDDFEDWANIERINGVRGTTMAVQKSPGANTVKVADDLRLAIERFNRDFQGRAQVDIVVDSSRFIRRSINDVQYAVGIGAVLALVVLVFFLRSLRSAMVIGVAIPISVIATFGLMYLFDLTLNLITFGGISLGIGMLVDNSIVILENIFRRREQGDSAVEAAVRGSLEVSTAVVASTLTTLAVFVPVVFLGGFPAVFFGQMALVVTAALLCSLVVALTLVPMFSSLMLRGSSSAFSAERRDPIGLLLGVLERAYGAVLGWCVRWPIVVVAVSVVVLVSVWSLRGEIGQEFLPSTDESEVRLRAQYPAGTRIEITEDAVVRMEELVRETVPEVTDMVAEVGTPGFWSTSGEESMWMRINLVPPEERTRSSEEIAKALSGRLSEDFPEMRAWARAGGGLWLFRFIRGGEDRLRIDVRGYDLQEADRLAKEVKALAEETEGVADVRVSRRQGGRELQLLIDRERISDLGIPAASVAESISTLTQGQVAGLYRETGDEYDIRVRLSKEALESVDAVMDTPLVSPAGKALRVRDVVGSEPGRTPQAIERYNQERIVKITGGLDGTRDLGAINAELREKIRALSMPDNFVVQVAGEGEEQADSFGALMGGFILALLLVYMVMAGQFESFLQPLVIMVSVPFAAVGVILTLMFTETTLNLNSALGIIVLVGVVVNNAIVLVDYINLLRRKFDRDLREAIVEASVRRLRPIFMTTLTTILALLPVAIGGGSAGEAQAPLARVVIGGMASSTFITLFLVPSLYEMLARAQLRVLRLFRRSRAADAAA